MTERQAGSLGGLPSPEQVTELLGGDFASAGYEIENVTVDTRTDPPRIIVVADGDTALDLDTVAELSRSASDRLDALDIGVATYVLEVTSPGVDRPLTTEKHFRRARGRKVEIELADGEALAARIGAVADGMADLVVRDPSSGDRSAWAVRRVPLADIRKAVVQVEFSAPSAKERELTGMEVQG
ncbi:MAG TPA: ribosome maturation factor RimP [Mycobacterium sp.]|uniref:ribosome maturation factor RimP n=1 Tax=Mycolicibacterium sp. TaxID=2320850 RepID=UPI0025F238A4|nr:ribosome maturation factor RimP [Mycolicibacterium sp.]HPX36259.1 ribosome maturation factor RimP [Mycobacterium sp.]HQC75176.1 ribosome maturation factor RimP [Mycobacterium sp.]